MPATIQWQNSAHSGLSRDGASGSVIARTYVMFDLQGLMTEAEVGSSLRWIEGAFCSLFGLTVLPRLAVSSDSHVMLTVRDGRKSSMTASGTCQQTLYPRLARLDCSPVGIISALISLFKCVSLCSKTSLPGR